MTAAFDNILSILNQSSYRSSLSDEEAATLIEEISARHSHTFIGIGSSTLHELLDQIIDEQHSSNQEGLHSVRGAIAMQARWDSRGLNEELRAMIRQRMEIFILDTLNLCDDNSMRMGVVLYSADGLSIFADTKSMTLPSAAEWALRQVGRTLPEIRTNHDEIEISDDGSDDDNADLVVLWGDRPVTSYQLWIFDNDRPIGDQQIKSFTSEGFRESVTFTL